MSDIRGYTTIAEHADPTVLARPAQPAPSGDEPCHPGRRRDGDAVRGGRRDGGLRGARSRPPTTPTGRWTRPLAMHAAQDAVNAEWKPEGRAPFGLGIGLSTGPVAAALLGCEERVEYTVVGDAVNLCQRLQQFAAARPDRAQRADLGGAHGAPDRSRATRTANGQGPRHAGRRLPDRASREGATT